MPDAWTSSGGDLHLDWEPATGRRGLTEALRRAIRSGRLPHGAALPSTRALAADLGLARGTVTRVYADLAVEGYVRTRQGAPTTVTADQVAAPRSAPRSSRPTEPSTRWSLRPGRPDLSLFPRQSWLAATRRVLRRVPSSALDYPAEAGLDELRASLAHYLARSRGVVAEPERIVVCAGYKHALSVLATVLREEGIGEVTFEDPSLWIFRDLATAAGLTVTGVDVDDAGARVSDVDTPAVVVTPAHQYPTGVTLAAHRRTALTRAAAATGTLVLEDDYDGEFRLDRNPVGAVQALAPEHVIYAGTTSKTLAPGLRLGWLVLPRSLVRPVRELVAARGGCPVGVLDQLTLADLLDSGDYDRHVRRMRLTYRRRRDRLLRALPRHLAPKGVPAGLQVLLPLPGNGPAEHDVLSAARARSLTLQGLARHWIVP
ncbi:MocR-like pyridoxine biosynthesis transcription factor PdxR, partial [Saccharomonospora saliphila]|uniref:MocR-like pyridoxine biosynthesis transcription factor PdxR n=1 Tax=Saccharomonospora saliphila TaxID=369829 RepID=UPI000381CFDC